MYYISESFEEPHAHAQDAVWTPLIYNLVYCCDFCEKLDEISFVPVSLLEMLIRIKLVQFCCLCQNIVIFFK